MGRHIFSQDQKFELAMDLRTWAESLKSIPDKQDIHDFICRASKQKNLPMATCMNIAKLAKVEYQKGETNSPIKVIFEKLTELTLQIEDFNKRLDQMEKELNWLHQITNNKAPGQRTTAHTN